MNGIEAVQGTNGAAYIIGKGQDKAEKTSVIFEPNVDKFNISGDYDFAKGEVGLREFFDSLKKDFPMIEFYVGDRFSDCTAADKNGVSVVLSERFMEKLVAIRQPSTGISSLMHSKASWIFLRVRKGQECLSTPMERYAGSLLMTKKMINIRIN